VRLFCFRKLILSTFTGQNIKRNAFETIISSVQGAQLIVLNFVRASFLIQVFEINFFPVRLTNWDFILLANTIIPQIFLKFVFVT